MAPEAAEPSMLIAAGQALDPRPNVNWGTVEALRAPVLVALAVAAWVATFFGVPVPEWLLTALTAAAAGILGLDTGLLMPQKKA